MSALDASDADVHTPLRLWTPWRMRYVAGGAKEAGCIFCNRLRADQDVASLILHRAPASFVIMNLFPYNTGHVMVVPNEHVDSVEALTPEVVSEMAVLLPPIVRACRRVLACHGFNIGMNIGAIAGAGVAEHLHQHVVPRWSGDANFMPILGSAMVLPELIPVTYAKLRAELTRELHGADTVLAVVVSEDRTRLGRVRGRLAIPAPLPPDRPVWRAAIEALGVPANVVGWAGQTRAEAAQPIALTLTVDDATEGVDWLPVETALAGAPPAGRQAAERALANLAPTFVLTES